MISNDWLVESNPEDDAARKDIILLVDDTPANLGVLSDFLDEAGFEVWVARDGESALRKVEYAQPDLILLDVMMPGIDGFETCDRLQLNPLTRQIPIIFMSALSETIDKIKGLSLGAVDYITKPFQQEEVLARVKLHLRLSKLTKTVEAQNSLLKQEISERTLAENALQKLTQELENRVAFRTAEVSQALQELQQTQLHLLQSEKLATLGQLVAGVAHEINNPLSCIWGNITHIEESIKGILAHLEIYQKVYPNNLPIIEQHREEIELDYLLNDLPKIMASMKVGVERISAISISLRNFYREDTPNKVEFNLHEGLDSTLLILQHRLKEQGKGYSIQVIKDYGNLPLIRCYPGQLNQVFMNILANGIDALEEAIQKNTLVKSNFAEKNQPKLLIRTEAKSDRVIVSIADNGPGIALEIQEKLFQPLFTTKPIGKGTGLGLAISRQIVEEKHHGKLVCISSPGSGAEFKIILPILADS